MKGLLLLSAILLQFTSCNQEPSKPPVHTKISSQVVIQDPSLKLKFTSGITAIFEDSKGNFWFGSHQEGVCLYNGKALTYLTINEGLSDNQIGSIQEDHNGIIWFGTKKGISSYNMGEIKDHPLEIDRTTENAWDKTENDLWFNAGKKEGIFRYDGQKFNYLPFPAQPFSNPNNPYSVTSLAKGANDMLWIATYAGIFGYDGNQFTIINEATAALPQGKGELHIRSILEDSKGRLWIGNNGIGVLLKHKDTFINFSEKYNLIHPTSSRSGGKSPAGTLEHVFAIEEDGEGNIWFGDRDTGIWKYDGTTMKNYTTEEGLTNNFVFTIYKDNKDELWVGLLDGNVFKFNGKTFDQQF